ncbi:MAG: DUF2680 domain-containing protein [Betaproteobacteria bacterium]
MKKLISGGLLAVLLLGAIGGAALTAAARAPRPGLWAAAQAKLTDKQKSELAELQRQILSIREKMIDKYVEYKWITPEQAQYLKDRIALQKKYAGQVGFGGGFGCGMAGGFGRRGGRGFGLRGGFGPGMMGGYSPWYDQAPNANGK